MRNASPKNTPSVTPIWPKRSMKIKGIQVIYKYILIFIYYLCIYTIKENHLQKLLIKRYPKSQ
jgi:hypothetical protein